MTSFQINRVLLLGCSSRKDCFDHWQRRFKKFLGPTQKQIYGYYRQFFLTDNADRLYVRNTLDKKFAKQPNLKEASRISMPHAAVYTELIQSCPVHYACAFVRLRDNKLICSFSPWLDSPNGPGPPRSHSDTQHSVGLLWTSDQPVADTSTWQHTTLTKDRQPYPRRDWTWNSSKRAAANPRIRPSGDWNWQFVLA